MPLLFPSKRSCKSTETMSTIVFQLQQRRKRASQRLWICNKFGLHTSRPHLIYVNLDASMLAPDWRNHMND
jgi:hypothetical protein